MVEFRFFSDKAFICIMGFIAFSIPFSFIAFISAMYFKDEVGELKAVKLALLSYIKGIICFGIFTFLIPYYLITLPLSIIFMIADAFWTFKKINSNKSE